MGLWRRTLVCREERVVEGCSREACGGQGDLKVG